MSVLLCLICAYTSYRFSALPALSASDGTGAELAHSLDSAEHLRHRTRHWTAHRRAIPGIDEMLSGPAFQDVAGSRGRPARSRRPDGGVMIDYAWLWPSSLLISRLCLASLQPGHLVAGLRDSSHWLASDFLAFSLLFLALQCHTAKIRPSRWTARNLMIKKGSELLEPGHR